MARDFNLGWLRVANGAGSLLHSRPAGKGGQRGLGSGREKGTDEERIMLQDKQWLTAMACYYLPLMVMVICIALSLAKPHKH